MNKFFTVFGAGLVVLSATSSALASTTKPLERECTKLEITVTNKSLVPVTILTTSLPATESLSDNLTNITLKPQASGNMVIRQKSLISAATVNLKFVNGNDASDFQKVVVKQRPCIIGRGDVVVKSSNDGYDVKALSVHASSATNAAPYDKTTNAGGIQSIPAGKVALEIYKGK